MDLDAFLQLKENYNCTVFMVNSMVLGFPWAVGTYLVRKSPNTLYEWTVLW